MRWLLILLLTACSAQYPSLTKPERYVRVQGCTYGLYRVQGAAYQWVLRHEPECTWHVRRWHEGEIWIDTIPAITQQERPHD